MSILLIESITHALVDNDLPSALRDILAFDARGTGTAFERRCIGHLRASYRVQRTAQILAERVRCK